MSCGPDASADACRRSGLIVTCYLNGRKLFRAVRLHEVPPRPVLMRPARPAAGLART